MSIAKWKTVKFLLLSGPPALPRRLLIKGPLASVTKQVMANWEILHINNHVKVIATNFTNVTQMLQIGLNSAVH